MQPDSVHHTYWVHVIFYKVHKQMKGLEIKSKTSLIICCMDAILTIRISSILQDSGKTQNLQMSEMLQCSLPKHVRGCFFLSPHSNNQFHNLQYSGCWCLGSRKTIRPTHQYNQQVPIAEIRREKHGFTILILLDTVYPANFILQLDEHNHDSIC